MNVPSNEVLQQARALPCRTLADPTRRDATARGRDRAPSDAVIRRACRECALVGVKLGWSVMRTIVQCSCMEVCGDMSQRR